MITRKSNVMQEDENIYEVKDSYSTVTFSSDNVSEKGCDVVVDFGYYVPAEGNIPKDQVVDRADILGSFSSLAAARAVDELLDRHDDEMQELIYHYLNELVEGWQKQDDESPSIH